MLFFIEHYFNSLMKNITVNLSSGLFHFQIIGERGDWVICWPGQAVDSISLQPFAHLLAEHHRVVLLDPPAVGLNAHFPYSPSLAQLLVYADAVMQNVAIKRCHWIGHSSGGSLGAALHAARPGCLQSLTLASAPMLSQSHVKLHHAAVRSVLAGFTQGRQILAKHFAKEVGARNGLERSEITAHFSRVMQSVSPSNIRKFQPLDSQDVRRAFEHLRKKPLPCLVLCGQFDGIVWPRDQHTVAEITHSTYIELKCGHMNLQVLPEDCAQAFLNFVRNCS